MGSIKAYNKRVLADWVFRQAGACQAHDLQDIKVSSFPTTVHVELLKLGKIPDPFVGLHEWDVQWIGESDWEFKSTFSVTQDDLVPSHADLIFEGLDTFATVTLVRIIQFVTGANFHLLSIFQNGKEILKTSNQFIEHRISVKDILKAGDNELLLYFESAFLKGRELEKQHGKLNLWNGDSSRLHVRKAQYNYGWDWGPILMTTGPWKPITLQTYDNRIAEVDIRTDVSKSLGARLSAEITFAERKRGFATFTLKGPDSVLTTQTASVPIDPGHAKVSFDFKPGEVKLWYPVGYGEQPLYTATVEITDEHGNVLDTRVEKIAFRRARIVQENLVDQDGLTFLFEINNVRIFCGGSNWIPADSFLTTVTPQRYKNWLKLVAEGNQNMIRVWGGGIYEHDTFYDTCDEFGLLVWQDFMFGCGQYPAYDLFIESVREEAVQNVKRLRHHPSIVIFAGNNEDYQIAESLNLELDYSDETSDFRKTNFPARYIYERVLPEVVEAHSNIFYHRASPYSGHGKPTTDRTLGDIHQWNVWHGSQEPWHNWDILAGRFVSEFGMEGYPNIRTVDYWLGGDNSERYPQSRVCNNHNKADGFERRLELYLMENFKHAFDMESYVYYTQIMQAETLASAYRLWRRNWRGPGREYTAGALVWQINDCWPVTSWAIIDYFLRPKPAYFSIARELKPYTVGMTRKEYQTFDNDKTAAFFQIKTVLEIWGTNSTLEKKNAKLELTAFDLHSDWTESWTKVVTLAPNSSTELYKGEAPGLPVRTKKSEVPRTIILSARLLGDSGEVFGRYSNWPEPFKFIKFPSVAELGLKTTVGQDGETLTLETLKPIKGIILDVDGEDVKWSDQAIDLVPKDPQTIFATGLNGRQIKIRFLGDGTA
ncbi:putative beta-mannosidase B [Leucoagaricus sp. SymC.cos]|nr:putative beta-mannosidase B [Leucoagaricus sp. SymC.cos]